jgi:hypothetical protein
MPVRFSVSKSPARLARWCQGEELDVDQPVATQWPEFAAEDKENLR